MNELEKADIVKGVFKTMKTIHRKMSAILFENGISLTPQQLFILKMISKEESVIQQDLADIMKSDKSALLRQLNVLQKEMLVARIPDEVDKRKKYLVLTAKGGQVLGEAVKVERDCFNTITDGVNDEDGIVFKKVLNQIQTNLG